MGGNFSDEILKNFKPVLDKDMMLQSHRKNLEALNEANKMAVEVMKSITQLQSQYVKQAFEDFAKIMKGMGSGGGESPRETGEAVKTQLAKAMEHGSAITNTLTKGQREIMEMMQNRFANSIDEIQDLQKKAGKKPH